MKTHMYFFDVNGKEITKAEASATVLALYKDYQLTNNFVNYHNITIETIKALGGDKVALYTNHAGNDICTPSYVHGGPTVHNVVMLNLQLEGN